ncbi:MAG: HNH endonuclease [Chloroflexota bacterium]|nr:HNH endonuclease [Chloroflexota bacterium]
MEVPVLVLNQNYEPLNVCNARRALVMVLGGKAEVLELNGHYISTTTDSFRCPSVIRLSNLIKRPRPRLKLSRKEVFTRDKHTCQYCGKLTKDLTLDHVVPKSRGGSHTWDNLVSACKSCNHRKGGKNPDEARMRLLSKPTEPRVSPYYIFLQKLQHSPTEEWRQYLPEGLASA